MYILNTFAATAALCLFATASMAKAGDLPPLSENEYINDQLFSAAVGAAIKEFCPTIAERKMIVAIEALKLFRHARGLGYSKKQIDDYLENEDARALMLERVRTYLEDKGVIEGEPETFCVAGRAEIKNKTFTGKLLKVHR